MYTRYPYPDELYHYGVKGMKWGIINEDIRKFFINRIKKKKKKSKNSRSSNSSTSSDDIKTRIAKVRQAQFIEQQRNQERDRRAQDIALQAQKDANAKKAVENARQAEAKKAAAAGGKGGGGFHSSAHKHAGDSDLMKKVVRPLFEDTVGTVKNAITGKSEYQPSLADKAVDKVFDVYNKASDAYNSYQTIKVLLGNPDFSKYSKDDAKKVATDIYNEIKPYVENIDTNKLLNDTMDVVSKDLGDIDSDDVKKELLKIINNHKK